MVIEIHIAVFLVMKSFILVDEYQSFGGTYCLQPQGESGLNLTYPVTCLLNNK
jgi:hypothetical protein